MRLSLFCLRIASNQAFADEVETAPWNGEQLFSVAAVNHRTTDLAAFVAQFSEVELLNPAGEPCMWLATPVRKRFLVLRLASGR